MSFSTRSKSCFEDTAGGEALCCENCILKTSRSSSGRNLELGPGLNILTGETGAGKSILVDAMHAILGARASRELVRTGAEKAVVCATFDPDPCRDWCEENEIECDDELIIRRQITAEGKTSCRVCGVPVTTAQLRTLGALLLDIHGQNDGQHLLDEREHLRNLDRFGQLEPELARYREQYQAYQALCKERDTLSTYENEKELLTESLRRQIEELERAGAQGRGRGGAHGAQRPAAQL